MRTDAPGRVVVALGGNALESAPGDVFGQAEAARRAFAALAPVLTARHLLITHGNGPQVGNLLLRSEAKTQGVPLPPLPLDTCVADTVGGLGYLLGRELRSELEHVGHARDVAVIVTSTLVGDTDGARRKPIGGRWSLAEADALTARGWEVRDMGDGTVRRVVPSPDPIEVLEAPIVARLFDDGVAVIAGGGGGVPVRRGADGALEGAEAVVDKDLVSALLAIRVSAELLMILTDVPRVYVGFGTPEQAPIERIGSREARDLIARGAFGEGSMAPKVEAACRFVDGGGSRAVICHLDDAAAGLAGTGGTQVVA